MAIGLLLAILLVRQLDRRFLRIGDRPGRRANLGLPVAGTVAVGSPTRVRMMGGYTPGAGLIADPESPRAMMLAAQLDETLDPASQSGSRTLVVVDPRSRAGHVRRMLHDIRAAGLDPVGLIMCGTSGKPLTHRTIGRVHGADE